MQLLLQEETKSYPAELALHHLLTNLHRPAKRALHSRFIHLNSINRTCHPNF